MNDFSGKVSKPDFDILYFSLGRKLSMLQFFYVFTTLTLKGKFWSKYDNDVVRISSLMVGFRYF